MCKCPWRQLLISTVSGHPQPDYPLMAPSCFIELLTLRKVYNPISRVDFHCLVLFCATKVTYSNKEMLRAMNGVSLKCLM